LSQRVQLVTGGFFTWNGGSGDPNIYMCPARQGGEKEAFRVAGLGEGYSAETHVRGGMVCDIEAFESGGARLITESNNADLIIMDELGYLESDAPKFKKAVLDAIAGNIPILGVVRLGDIPWHKDIKLNHSVTLIDVNMENRGVLPFELVDKLLEYFRNPG